MTLDFLLSSSAFIVTPTLTLALVLIVFRLDRLERQVAAMRLMAVQLEKERAAAEHFRGQAVPDMLLAMPPPPVPSTSETAGRPAAVGGPATPTAVFTWGDR